MYTSKTNTLKTGHKKWNICTSRCCHIVRAQASLRAHTRQSWELCFHGTFLPVPATANQHFSVSVCVCFFFTLSGIFPLEHFDTESSSDVAAAGHARESCFFFAWYLSASWQWRQIISKPIQFHDPDASLKLVQTCICAMVWTHLTSPACVTAGQKFWFSGAKGPSLRTLFRLSKK